MLLYEPPYLDQPYHDMGPLCVENQYPALNDEVSVKVWVPDSYPIESLTLRQTLDGEPLTAPCQQISKTELGAWYQAKVIAHNPVTRYRFVAVGRADNPIPYAWLTAAGLQQWDSSDVNDFTLTTYQRAPKWVNEAVVYQIFPDRFARSQSAASIKSLPQLPEWAIAKDWDEAVSEDGYINGKELYGGDLAGIVEKLDYLQELGVNTLYLCPIFPATSAHRYDATTFDEVDELLGGNQALIKLSTALHERDMRLILDLTTNHTGDQHEWFKAAKADPNSVEAGFYFFNQHPDDYVSWLGVKSLPKLDHSNQALRQRMYEGLKSVTHKWLAKPYAADGWRIDVANMTGRYQAQDIAHEVALSVRSTLGAEHWLLAEHFHDATRDLNGDGWHGAMNYTGFTRPLWGWLSSADNELNWFGLPMQVPQLKTAGVLRNLMDYNAQMPWHSRLSSQNQLCSHDTARIRTVIKDPLRHAVALAALITLPGVPTIFAGDELALEGLNGEHSRTPMPWDEIESGENEDQRQWLELTKRAFAIRKEQLALQSGGFRLVHASEQSFTFMRTHLASSVLVHLARAAHEPIKLSKAHLLGSNEKTLLQTGEVSYQQNTKELEISASNAGALLLEMKTQI